jgi:hypothetical protein
MKTVALVLLASLFATAVSAQTVQRVRPIGPTVPVAPTTAAPSDAASLPKDYQAMYQKEAAKNRELRAQVDSLTARIAEMTRPGGSLVQAYCETPTMSRNTAGASNDCARTGYGCEPVSGLCRTTARSTDECAAGYVYCATNATCVNSADACR